MSDFGGQKNATNEHFITRFHNLRLPLGWAVWKLRETGFVFLRGRCSGFLTKTLPYKNLSDAAFIIGISHLGSFESNDERLNEIWLYWGRITVPTQTMQNYLWDGIKRDRLVWVRRHAPESNDDQYLSGKHEIVTRAWIFCA